MLRIVCGAFFLFFAFFSSAQAVEISKEELASVLCPRNPAVKQEICARDVQIYLQQRDACRVAACRAAYSEFLVLLGRAFAENDMLYVENRPRMRCSTTSCDEARAKAVEIDRRFHR